MRSDEIKNIVRDYEIRGLVHFTRLENLPSILEHGLIARENISSEAIFNDKHRFDGRRDTVSLSISFPNFKMFYKYRQEMQGKWCVLGLHPSVLWELDSLFCQFNAADNRISSMTDEQLALPQSLIKMFLDQEGELSRAENKLKCYDPTDPQAEVLVKDTIPPHYITGVIFPDAPSKKQYQHLSDRMKIIEGSRNKGFFASRKYVRR